MYRIWQISQQSWDLSLKKKNHFVRSSCSSYSYLFFFVCFFWCVRTVLTCHRNQRGHNCRCRRNPTPLLLQLHISVTQENSKGADCYQRGAHVQYCTYVCTRPTQNIVLMLKCLVNSRRSTQSSIVLWDCAARRLHSGTSGRPCPPLYWSEEDSSSAPLPWTRSTSVGSRWAPPPPHRRVPPGYWQTGTQSKKLV